LRRQVGLRTDSAQRKRELTCEDENARMIGLEQANPSAAGTDTLFKYDKKIFDPAG